MPKLPSNDDDQREIPGPATSRPRTRRPQATNVESSEALPKLKRRSLNYENDESAPTERTFSPTQNSTRNSIAKANQSRPPRQARDQTLNLDTGWADPSPGEPEQNTGITPRTSKPRTSSSRSSQTPARAVRPQSLPEDGAPTRTQSARPTPASPDRTAATSRPRSSRPSNIPQTPHTDEHERPAPATRRPRSSRASQQSESALNERTLPKAPRTQRSLQYDERDTSTTSSLRLRELRQTRDHALDLGTNTSTNRVVRPPAAEDVGLDPQYRHSRTRRPALEADLAEDEYQTRRLPAYLLEDDGYQTRRLPAHLLEEGVQTAQAPRGTTRLRTQRLPEQDLAAQAGPEQPGTTNKIMVSQRKRSQVSDVLPATYYQPRGQELLYPRRSPWRRLKLTPAFLIVLISCIALLLFIPIASNFLTTYAPGGQLHLPFPGNQPTSSNNEADTHELVITPTDTDHPAPPVNATAAYLLDADTGATLYASNPFMHLPMLSTTKLMTALLAAEQGDPDRSITITDSIQNDINQLSADSALMGIKKGETYTLRELLYGLLLVSGNDAAVVIADAIGGSQQAFIAKMNARADQLGMHDTHFLNPHGLLMTGHFSSAHDLAVLGRASLGNAFIHEISATRHYQIPQTDKHPAHDLDNGNQFLWWYPGADAGKTGWDAGTNFIQVVECNRNNHHLIGVTLHTNNWWTDMRDLMNWGYNNFTWTSPKDADAKSPIPFGVDWNHFTRDKKENTIPTASSGRYYIYSGYSISGPILDFFDKNNGLDQFGYPQSQPQSPATNILKQRFDHGSIQCDLTTKQCTKV
ncbi:D-alanyl-D-alanine carboxypeptidase family protein [Tengunoibacter tsumagoiensis]|uniref:Peptidase S11 D-alanyl-D-alanine carboxypeptidase A N-terminal domain-containing protein n=1 Tax=Tengunoibacter tsumagoiensis TaxID=2014871 RepID=A0A402A404_9CHLR|nr:serine hydrolase [Tengunoibacter tsumagoiensis]GCE13735.1 hypothetical protein KTT_35940 [Tengunoibacter tsumagoiensis]